MLIRYGSDMDKILVGYGWDMGNKLSFDRSLKKLSSAKGLLWNDLCKKGNVGKIWVKYGWYIGDVGKILV